MDKSRNSDRRRRAVSNVAIELDNTKGALLMKIRLLPLTIVLVLPFFNPPSHGADTRGKPGAAASVSYYEQVLPIFQANCQGCHQPAKMSGGYLMTEFPKLLVGGASKKPICRSGLVWVNGPTSYDPPGYIAALPLVNSVCASG